MQQNPAHKHKAEKQDTLETQRVNDEKHLASTSSMELPSLEEEWERRNGKRVLQFVLQANRLVQEANMLADELHKDTLFKVALTIPKSFLCHKQTMNSEDMSTSNEVAIRVLHKRQGTDSVLSLDALEEKVLTMREMYERMEEGGPLLDESLGPDPFYDLEQHALLGVANFSLECLHYGIKHEYSAPIVTPIGNECGRLKVIIERVTNQVEVNEVDIPQLDTIEEGSDLQLAIGKRLACKITVVEATGLPKEYSHYVFCQYQFFDEVEAMIIPPLIQPGPEKLKDRIQRFEHSKTFIIDVTEELLEFIDSSTLAVEVWGHGRSTFMEMQSLASPNDDTKLKSLPEQWDELNQRLQLWVEIMELNDEGEYIPVEIQTKPDVTCGGIFMIQQGQSHRINVSVCPVPDSGSSPLRLDHISSVSLGSIYLRHREDEPLDSYQPHDVERLRKKWSDDRMNRRDYLDTEVRKIMDKKEPSVMDLERQNELLDQWAMLQWQRAAVLKPKAGSGVPGSPSNWQLSPEFETKVPVLFLDLNDDHLTPCDDDPEGAIATGKLHGEETETMINLMVMTRNGPSGAPNATASWDSTLHNIACLNKITGSNDRVYAILKVGVVLAHPPGIELFLRKRICLRIYKTMDIGSRLLRVFRTKDIRTACAVMFEVVMGIPTSEGMRPPPKIPANPSLVELCEDENAVEKFKKAVENISSILLLDSLKQELALKEKLTTCGIVIRKKKPVGKKLDQPRSTLRSDSEKEVESSEGPALWCNLM